jgi:hypothetical protein
MIGTFSTHERNFSLFAGAKVAIFFRTAKLLRDFLQKSLFRGCFDHFEIETKGAETIVTTDHGAHRILHPAIVEVAFASGQCLHELTHGRPGRRTQTLRTGAIDGYPLLAHADIARMLDGVFVFRHQVGIDGLADGGDSDFVHLTVAIVTGCKDTNKWSKTVFFTQLFCWNA